MELINVLGYVAAFVVGFVLGLIGGGGSILSVPIFVYLFGITPVIATAYSLFVVGLSSLIGGIIYARKQLVDFKIALIFSIPAFIGVYISRKYILPAIPTVIFQSDNVFLSKNVALMVFFGFIMLLAAYSMIKDGIVKIHEYSGVMNYNLSIIIVVGAVVGVVTGLVGAGGGFLIVPSLVILAKIPIRMAVGTTLVIIATKSLIGFVGDIENFNIDWNFLFAFSGIAVIGIIVGTYLSKMVPSKKLKRWFGWFVLIIATYIFVKEMLM